MSKVHWGLIGCGDIARKRVAPALLALPNCELVAVNRADFGKAESFAREFGARRWYRDWRELLADEEVSAVYIATPVHLHAAQAIAAAEAGKHVLCEKPMALSFKECERMVAACEAHQVRLGVAYYRHYYPVIERIKTILSSGEIGRPVIAQVNAFERFDPEPSNPRRWLLEKKLSGGGPMFDFGCHRIEILINLFGQVREARGLLSNALFEREVEDTATALLQFESGPQAVLSVTHAAHAPQDALNIFGSNGSIHVAILNEGTMKVKTEAGERIETHPPHSNLHQPLIDDFAQAALQQRAPQVDGRAGLEVARIEEEIYGKASSEACSGLAAASRE
jgi:predicted dehydrogenase